MAQQGAPAPYPTGGDYVDALQHPGFAFTDPQLRAGTVKTDDLGLPEPVSGNFASVFQILGTGGERWAVKCFVRPDPDRHRRYRAIATALQALHHPALVDFDYQVEGVMVAGVRYPLLKMRWIQAQGLMPWVESRLSFPDRILTLAAQFADVVTALERAGIAHGDLQHGNLLITDHDELKLIDYDGMYVPEIAGLPPNEKGLVNYQHPRRSDSDYGPGLDRFSAWVIYTSLVALAARPELWRRLRASDDDTKLLFASADYLDPTASNAFRELRTGGLPYLAALADQLTAFVRMAPAQLPALEPVPVGEAITVTPTGQTAEATDAPDWLVDHLPTSASASPQATRVGATVRPPTYSFGGTHLTIARTAAVLTLLAMAGGAASIFGYTAPADVPVIGWFLAALVGAIVIVGTYHWHPLTAARKVAAEACATAHEGVAAAEEELRQLQRLIVKAGSVREAQRRMVTEQRDAAVRERDAAAAQAQQALQQALQAVRQRRSDWNNTQQAREQKRLAEIAAEHVQRALAGAVIAKNPPRGIDLKIAGALAAHGFRTAADFIDYRTVSGHGRNDRTFIKRHKSDYGTYVENVGEKRAQALLQWRENIINRAQNEAPRTLTEQQRREVAAQQQQFHAALDAQENAAKQQARTAIDQARNAEQAAQVALDRQEQQMAFEHTAKRANLERRFTGAQLAVKAARRDAAYLNDAFAPFEQATARKYLSATAGASPCWTV